MLSYKRKQQIQKEIFAAVQQVSFWVMRLIAAELFQTVISHHIVWVWCLSSLSWNPQNKYNCGLFDVKNDFKIPPICAYGKRRLSSLTKVDYKYWPNQRVSLCVVLLIICICVCVCVYRIRRRWHSGLWWKLSSTCQATTVACASAICWDGQLSSATCSSLLISWDRSVRIWASLYTAYKIYKYNSPSFIVGGWRSCPPR